MNNKIFNLLEEMHELAETQRDALLGGKLEGAVAIQERRQKIINEIQNIDSNSSSSAHFNDTAIGKKYPLEENISPHLLMMLEKILSLDREIKTIIVSNCNSISEKLHTIQKAKAFCLNVVPHQRWGQLLRISA